MELSAALKSRPGRTIGSRPDGSSGTLLGGGMSESMTGRGTVGNSCSTATNASSVSATLNSIGSSAYGGHTSSVTTNTGALERTLAGYGSAGTGGSAGSGGVSRGIDGMGGGLGHSTSIGMSSSSGIGTGSTGNTGGSTVTWAPTPTGHQQGTEIDRIMAKIEQARLSIANDNRILAELEHPRTTGPIMSSALGTGGLTSVSTSLGLSSHQTHLHQTPSSLASQISTSAMLSGLSGLTGSTMPTAGLGMNSIGLGGSGSGAGVGVSSAMAAGISSITGGISSMGVTSSTSSHALTDGQYSALTSSTGGSSTNHYSTNANVSPLPSRANPMSTTMPPLCQPIGPGISAFGDRFDAQLRIVSIRFFGV
uniref:Uncharacterized protein n=1 Tax=Anopheles culicifacies TaxID=139723 RepID=A0A182MM83_9DIPT